MVLRYLEACLFDEARDVARQVAALIDPLVPRFTATLLVCNLGVRMKAVLAKEKLASWAQHATNLVESLGQVWDRAEGLGRQDSVDTVIIEWDSFCGRAEQLDCEVHALRGSSGLLYHLRVGIEPVDFVHAAAIVEGKRPAAADANFED